MQITERNGKRRLSAVLLPVGAVVLILLVLQLIYGRRMDGFVQLDPVDGVLDVRQVDFSHEIYTIANDWDFYPEQLYTSADFAAGLERPEEVFPNQIPYGTHRLVIRGKPNQYYSICGYSTDYGSRVLVDGVELAAFGVVSEDPETSVPKTGYQTIPFFTGEDGETEIICQYVNFVHKDGGTIHATYLSTPQNIEDYKTGNSVVSVALGGGLLVMAMYFLLCAAVQRQHSYLLLAFCCLVFALRDQLFAFISLMPNLPWAVGYRMNISVVNLLPVSLVLLLGNAYPAPKPWVRRCYLAVAVFFLAVLAVADTKQLVAINVVSYCCCVPYLVYVLWQIVRYFRRTRQLTVPDGIFLSGFAVLIFSVVVEGILTKHNAAMVRYGMSPSAMLLFVFLVALSIGLQQQAREIELAKTRSRSELLEQMNEMNLDYLHKIAHELKTPLTVISGYAQLTNLQLAAGLIHEETSDNLETIHEEAQRLADMVTKLMEYSYGRREEQEFSPVSVERLMEGVRAICGPICMKNRNTITVTGIEGTIYGSAEMLLQIFINLVVNANRHTHDGTIAVSASEQPEEGAVVFYISDTGNGISPTQLPHIFEKGYSADNGSGLGLTICADALKLHGGRIWVEKTGPEGTVFAFTVPRTEGEHEHHSFGGGQSAHHENQHRNAANAGL